MKKFFDVAETTILTIYCIILIGVILFEHMIYNTIEIFKNEKE